MPHRKRERRGAWFESASVERRKLDAKTDCVLATALHDQVGQTLVFSKLKLDLLRNSVASGELTEALEEVCSCLGQVIDDTRTLTFDLSSPILHELGFEVAVAEWLADEIQKKHRIETEFEDDGQLKPMDDDMYICLMCLFNLVSAVSTYI